MMTFVGISGGTIVIHTGNLSTREIAKRAGVDSFSRMYWGLKLFAIASLATGRRVIVVE